MPRALISVFNKDGVVQFARALSQEFDYDIISTGGTARALRLAGLPVRDVSEVTGFKEMMDGRVKTLHPKVHGGLLALRDNPEHMAALKEHEITPIDLVAVNLYPFREAAAQPGAKPEHVIEQIDIGGPAMLRSAAKNAESVWMIVEPEDYNRVLDVLRRGGNDPQLRRELRAAVFRHTSEYDKAIADWSDGQV